MSITITIGGIDVTDAIDFRSIAIEQHQEVKGDTLSCNMRRYDSTYDAPVAGKEIIVTAGSTKEFGGVILEVTRRQREGNSVDYELRCSDYVYYLDRRHLNDIFALRATYPNGQSIDGIMSAMLDSLHVLAQNDNAAPNQDTHYKDFATDKTKITSPAGKTYPLLKEQRVDRQRPSAVFDLLVEAAGMQWKINYDKQVVLFEIEGNPATHLPIEGDFYTLNVETNQDDFYDMIESENIQGTSTRPIIRDAQIRSTVSTSDTFEVRSVKETKYGLSHRPFSLVDITSVTKAGVTQTQHLDGVARDIHDITSATNSVFIYLGPAGQENAHVRFPPGNLSVSQEIVVTYNYSTVDDHENDDPQARQILADRTGGDGVHEFIFSQASDVRVADMETLDHVSDLILNRKAQVQRTGTFSSLTSGWEAGQVFYISWPSENLSYLAYVIIVRKTVLNPVGSDPIFENSITFSNIPTGLRL